MNTNVMSAFKKLQFKLLNNCLSLVFQKYNADYDLSAKEGADTLAFVSLLEEKLLPALVRSEMQKGVFTPCSFEAFVSEPGRFSSLVEFV